MGSNSKLRMGGQARGSNSVAGVAARDGQTAAADAGPPAPAVQGRGSVAAEGDARPDSDRPPAATARGRGSGGAATVDVRTRDAVQVMAGKAFASLSAGRRPRPSTVRGRGSGSASSPNGPRPGRGPARRLPAPGVRPAEGRGPVAVGEDTVISQWRRMTVTPPPPLLHGGQTVGWQMIHTPRVAEPLDSRETARAKGAITPPPRRPDGWGVAALLAAPPTPCGLPPGRR